MSEDNGLRAHSEEQSRELHVVFGTGAVGLAVVDELSTRGKCVRLVNRSGKAATPEGATVVPTRNGRGPREPGGG